MPPGPFITSNPKVIVLLDGKSFPVLFDASKVEKKDLFTGTFCRRLNSPVVIVFFRISTHLNQTMKN